MASRMLTIAPLFTAAQRRERLRFSRNHEYWTVDDWKKFLCSYEARVSLKAPDGRENVWQRPEERFAACTISPRKSLEGGGGGAF